MFVLDPTSIPTLVDRPTRTTVPAEVDAVEQPTRSSRRLSISSLGRSISRESRSSGPGTATNQSAPVTTTSDSPEAQGGLRGLVKKIVSAVSPSSSKKELPTETALVATPGDALHRSSTRERQEYAVDTDVAPTQPAEPIQREPVSGTGLTFEEPETMRTMTEDPLPSFKVHSASLCRDDLLLTRQLARYTGLRDHSLVDRFCRSYPFDALFLSPRCPEHVAERPALVVNRAARPD